MEMEERYEIRSTLGKGGLGTVYRAYDRSLKREVAIKRIIAGDDGQTEEASRQMEQETGALAALQHPHIVTIYDVGTDDDGPFVVMELLKGNTLDELVEKAPLTWQDFRELVQQIMEGLIAAQDLGLLHRDLKPSNVMINWLPSGKFQAKIVDFGLAKFSPKPSSQTLDHNDSVYGSIFYMAPEQFERAPLDTRTDMYAIGCVYYFALTGQTPFSGDTGPQVMASHLEHRVVPLAELRPDIPQWVADWVMWHVNRTPAERPENAREALRNFIELDVPVTESMSNGPSETPSEQAPKRPRLIIPGATPEAETPQPAAPATPTPAPVQPVTPAAPAQPVQPVTSAQPAPEAQTGPVPAPPVTQTAPQPLSPPAGAPPSIHTTSQQADASAAEASPDAPPPAAPVQPAQAAQATPVVQPAQPATAAQPTPGPKPVLLAGGAAQPATSPQPVPVAQPVPTASPAAAGSPGTPAPGQVGQTTIGNAPVSTQKGLSGGAKIAIAIVLAVVVVILGMVILNTMSKNKVNERYNELVAIAADPATEELPVSAGDLDILLNSVRAGSNRSRETVYKALAISKATGSTDVDTRIAEFATTELLPDDIRVSLLERVLRRRASASTVPILLKFARETENDRAAAAALTAVTEIGGESEIDEFLEVIQFTSSSSIRSAAEKATAAVLEKTENRENYASTLVTAAESATDDDVRRALIRLLGHAGGDLAMEKVTAALEGEDNLDTLAALQAIQAWPNDSLFEDLIAFLEEQTDDTLRRKTFDAAYAFLMDKDRAAKRDDLDSEDYWKMLARNAKTEREQFSIISGLAKSETADWALSVVEYFADEAESDRVIDQAEKAINHMRERAKIKGEAE